MLSFWCRPQNVKANRPCAVGYRESPTPTKPPRLPKTPTRPAPRNLRVSPVRFVSTA